MTHRVVILTGQGAVSWRLRIYKGSCRTYLPQLTWQRPRSLAVQTYCLSPSTLRTTMAAPAPLYVPPFFDTGALILEYEHGNQRLAIGRGQLEALQGGPVCRQFSSISPALNKKRTPYCLTLRRNHIHTSRGDWRALSACSRWVRSSGSLSIPRRVGSCCGICIRSG